MNKYEKSILLNLKIIKVAFILLTLINLFLPYFTPVRFGYRSLFTYIVITLHFIGLLGALSYLNQTVPILPVGLARIVELIWHIFISKYKFNWILFIVILLVDILFITLLLVDKGTYEYVRSVDDVD